jgi:DNA-binding MarR family transcriptional regulator
MSRKPHPAKTTPERNEIPDSAVDVAAALEKTAVYQLLVLINLISKPFFGEFEQKYALSINEWRILVTLANHPGITASQICDLTGMHIMNVSRAVRSLARKSRVERMVLASDRRQAALRLTDEGMAIFAEIGPEALKRTGFIRDALSPQEARTFERLLMKLADHMRSGSNGI